jgi:hypothetical protein
LQRIRLRPNDPGKAGMIKGAVLSDAELEKAWASALEDFDYPQADALFGEMCNRLEAR